MLGPIMLGCGLRQGDPISPYLFIICAESLTALVRNYKSRGLIHGCKVAISAPIISHLFFADDSFFFFKANMRNANILRSVSLFMRKRLDNSSTFRNHLCLLVKMLEIK